MCTVNSMLDAITKFKQEYNKNNKNDGRTNNNIWQKIRKSIQRQFLTVAKNIFLVVHNEFIDDELLPFANNNNKDFKRFSDWITARKKLILEKFKIQSEDIFHLALALNNDKICMIPGQAANYSMQKEYPNVRSFPKYYVLGQYLDLLINTFTKEKRKKATERKPRKQKKTTTKKDNEKSKDNNDDEPILANQSSSYDNNKGAVTTSKQKEEEKDNKALMVNENDLENIIKDITIARRTSPIFDSKIIQLTTANITKLVVPFISELLFGVDTKRLLVLSAYTTFNNKQTIPPSLLYFFKYNYQRIIKFNDEMKDEVLFVKCYKSFYDDLKKEVGTMFRFRVITKSTNRNWEDRYSDIPPRGFCAYLAMQYLSLRYKKICELERNTTNNTDECYKTVVSKDICQLVWKVEDADQREAFKTYLTSLLTRLEKNNTNASLISCQKISKAIAALDPSNITSTKKSACYVPKDDWAGFPTMQFLFHDEEGGRKFPFLWFQPLEMDAIATIAARPPFGLDNKNSWFDNPNEWLLLYAENNNLNHNSIYLSIDTLKKRIVEAKNNAICFQGGHFYPFEMFDIDVYEKAMDEAFDNYCKQLFSLLFKIMQKDVKDGGVVEYCCELPSFDKEAINEVKDNPLKVKLLHFCNKAKTKNEADELHDLITDDEEENKAIKKNVINYDESTETLTNKKLMNNDEGDNHQKRTIIAAAAATEFELVNRNNNNSSFDKSNIKTTTNIIDFLNSVKDILSSLSSSSSEDKELEEIKNSVEKYLQKSSQS